MKNSERKAYWPGTKCDQCKEEFLQPLKITMVSREECHIFCSVDCLLRFTDGKKRKAVVDTIGI